MSACSQSGSLKLELPAEWKIRNISAHMLQLVKPAPTSDSSKRRGNAKAKEKSKAVEKNKELGFTFKDSSDNHLDFLSAILKKHGYDKYTPVTNRRQFGIQVLVPPKKAYVIGLFPLSFRTHNVLQKERCH